MKNILLSDEEGGIDFYAGKVVSESDLDALEAVLDRLFGKMQKLEKRTPTPEGTRLNILEYMHDTLRTAQAETSKVLEDLKEEVATLAQRQNLNRKAHIRIYREIDDHRKTIDDLQYSYTEDVEARRRRDKRLTDIEEFIGDI